MFILLPDQCDGISYILKALKTFDINQLRGQKYAWVGVTLPLFNIEYSFSVNGALKKVNYLNSINMIVPIYCCSMIFQLGLGNILSKNADFGGIVDDSPPTAHVSQFIHKVLINMTETAAIAADTNQEKGNYFIC